MDPTQLLTNPVYHWYPANIYHKTFHKPPSVEDDGYTHKSPAPTTTNVCSSCGQPIVVVETNSQVTAARTVRQKAVGGVVIAIMLFVLLLVGVNTLFKE